MHLWLIFRIHSNVFFSHCNLNLSLFFIYYVVNTETENFLEDFSVILITLGFLPEYSVRFLLRLPIFKAFLGRI